VSDSFSVFGETGIRYSGSVRISTNGRTVIFKPFNPFPLGEIVNVRLGPIATLGEANTAPFVMSFTVRSKLAFPDTSFHSDDPLLEHQLHKPVRMNMKNGSPVSASHAQPQGFPGFNIISEDNPSDGNMFIANYKNQASQSDTYRMILDKYGEVVYAYGGGPDYYYDFKPNPNGTYSLFDAENEAFFILDTNLSLIDMVAASNGYVTDAHEIRVTAEGNYFILAADYEYVDMSKIVVGGFNSATVLVPVIQEFDRDSNLLFEWRTIDHFKITDATHEDSVSDYIDFCHANAIEFDADSNLLLSCRHMDEMTKINRETGEIMWRWGGKNNQFKFIGDTLPFSHQHAIRRTDAGTYTMFDNGNFHPLSSSYSRAVEYALDQTNMTATKVWEFRHKPDVLSPSMGYVQRLPNQHTFIGWGESDNLSVTELDSDNNTLYEMGMTDKNYSYRAYKYDSNYVHGKINSSVALTQPAGINLLCSPNPVTDMAQISCTVSDFGPMQIALYDQLGRVVSNIFSGNLSQGEHAFSISARRLSAGIYFLRATGRNGVGLEKSIAVMK
ncbi:MAG: aryl-sulfate sulfotransferase, partial [Candidatus Kapaibacterium sp.]